MNHKRKRPKAARAGCLFCKPHKLGQGMERQLGKTGWSRIRGERIQEIELKIEFKGG